MRISLQEPAKQWKADTRGKQLVLKFPARPLNPKLLEAHEIFRRWLGRAYDTQLLDIVLATAAGNIMKGEPIWLMIVGGSGTGKTEVAKSLEGINAHIVSTIHSEGALLSASEKLSQGGTGGLLNKIDKSIEQRTGVNIAVLKDFTTILSMPDRGTRPMILAALREIHDGKWVRHVGVDGGQTRTWKGRIGIVGCCTTAWDSAHAAIATMGDRFVVVRINSRDIDARLAAANQAMANIGHEARKDSELKGATAGVLSKITPDIECTMLPLELHPTIVAVCEIASRARTPTEHGPKGEVIYSHDPESPTRLSKALGQMIQGALAIGIPLDQAFNMVMRCLRDTIPPIRLECLQYIHSHPEASINDIMYAIQRPWNAIDRACQALFSAEMLSCTKLPTSKDGTKSRALYSLRHGSDMSLFFSHAVLEES